LILDASDKINPHKFPPNVRYLHVPGMSLNKRLRKFATLVDTDYILLSPDDDFYSLAGINEVISFLENNKDYSSAQGLRIRFGDKPIFNWIPDYTKQIELNFNQDDPVQRTLAMAKSMHYIYSIIRTSNYKELVSCLKNTDSDSRDSYAVTELIFNYCLPVFGKHKILPLLYQLRKSHEPSGYDINFSVWVNNELDKSAISLKQNVLDFYMYKTKISKHSADEIYSSLTQHFSKPKKALNSQKLKDKIRKKIRALLIDYKIFYFIRLYKFSYFRFYYLLFKHEQFKVFKFEIRSLRNFLEQKTTQLADHDSEKITIK
jgi:glycosyltransferase domain-containing protein